MKKLLLMISLFAVNIYAENQMIVNDPAMPCSDDSRTSEERIEKLIGLMFNKEQISNLTKAMLQQTLRQMPAESQKDIPVVEMVIDRMADKFSSKESIKDFANVYSKHFSDDDIKEMLKFYESPVGKKVLRTMPQVASDCGQISMKIAQEVMLECMPQENNCNGNNCCAIEK